MHSKTLPPVLLALIMLISIQCNALIFLDIAINENFINVITMSVTSISVVMHLKATVSRIAASFHQEYNYNNIGNLRRESILLHYGTVLQPFMGVMTFVIIFTN